MSDIVQFVYTWLIPLFSCFCFVYLISLLWKKENALEHIEFQYLKAIESNKKISDEAIQKHFTNTQIYTKRAIQEISTSAQNELKGVAQKIEKTEERQDAVLVKLENVNKQADDLLYLVEKIAHMQKMYTKQIQEIEDLAQKNKELHQAIEERNHRLSRKNQQIFKLKEQKNAIQGQ